MEPRGPEGALPVVLLSRDKSSLFDWGGCHGHYCVETLIVTRIVIAVLLLW